MKNVVLAHGPGGLFDLFPFLFIIAAIVVIVVALKDGQEKRSKTTEMPNTPFSRGVHAATRRPRPERKEAPSTERLGRRFGAPRLEVMEGESESNRPAIPRRFEPPPPSRRKTG